MSKRLQFIFSFILALTLIAYFSYNPILNLFEDKSEFKVSEEILKQEGTGLGSLEAKAAISDELTNLILSDYKDLIPSEFDTSPYFYPFVRFWFGIYTRYDSNQVVIHDKDNLGVIYGVLDFTKLKEGNVNRFAKAAIVQKIINEKMEEIKTTFLDLSQAKTDSSLSLSLLKTLVDNKMEPPLDPLERKKFFEYRLSNIRTQTGQRDSIGAGINRMQPYTLFLNLIFNRFQMPPELTAIPFLESSFNNIAESKVGALGIWQFMPYMGSHFMPKRSEAIDYRINPFIASIGALHLLKENHKILKNWDLAVTAYNSGTKHLVKARKDLGIKHLEEIFIKYDHPHIGFASKNFYAEFLALVATLAYREQIFPDTQTPTFYDPDRLKIGPLKCKVNLKQLKKNLGDEQWSRFKELNPHLLKDQAIYPRGTLIVSEAVKTNDLVLELSPKLWVETIPHKWEYKYLKKNQSCSTR